MITHSLYLNRNEVTIIGLFEDHYDKERLTFCLAKPFYLCPPSEGEGTLLFLV